MATQNDDLVAYFAWVDEEAEREYQLFAQRAREWGESDRTTCEAISESLRKDGF